MIKRSFLLLFVLALLWSSIAMAAQNTATPRMPLKPEASPSHNSAAGMLTYTSYIAADSLQKIMHSRINRQAPILVASMVSLGNLGETSALGRLIMQQVGTRISQYGYKVVESRLGRDMVMRARDGEFILTRDIARIAQGQYNAQAALVGNYVRTKETVFVSLRLLRLDDSSVVAGFDYELPYEGVVKRMLKTPMAPANTNVWQFYAARPSAFSGGQSQFAAPKVPLTAQPVQPLKSFPSLGPPKRIDR